MKTLVIFMKSLYEQRKIRQIFLTGISSLLLIFVVQPYMEFSKQKKEKSEKTEQTEGSKENTKAEQKGGGKNSQHINQKAREVAKEKWEKAKTEFKELNNKKIKSKEDYKLLDKLERQIKHWKNKMDNTGENHSQKTK